MTSDEVKKILPSGFKLILDHNFTLPSIDEVVKSAKLFVENRAMIDAIKKSIEDGKYLPQKVDREPFNYVPDQHDCDNGVMEMLWWFSGKGWPVGLAVIESHALVIVIADDRKYHFINQYTGELAQNSKRLKVTVIT